MSHHQVPRFSFQIPLRAKKSFIVQYVEGVPLLSGAIAAFCSIRLEKGSDGSLHNTRPTNVVVGSGFFSPPYAGEQ